MSRTNSTSTTVKATLLLASTLTVMSGATISPALPAIQAHFTGTENAALLVRLVLTMPALFIALTAPLVGGVADRAECKPLLVGSTVLYAIAGGSGFVLDSLLAIIVGRAALGVAVGGITVGATALITDYYVGEQRDSVLGLQGSFTQFGGVLFLPLGGVLADVGWRMPLLIYLTSLLLLPTMLLSLYESEGTATDSTSDAPMDLDSLRSTIEELPWRSLAPVYAIALFVMIVFYMIPVQIPFYLENLTGATATLIGIAPWHADRNY